MIRILIIGAHPDDPDNSCGGLALKMRRAGNAVTFLSMTNGCAGHQTLSREALIARRAKEVENASKAFDIPYLVLPIDDASLEATLENRRTLMRLIRKEKPDVIITHRSCDYHPDHRACGQLVTDCAYMMGVPLFCPDVECLRKAPVILSVQDDFTYPAPFRADLAVPIDSVIEEKVAGVLTHESQYYEWLPWADHWPEIENAPSREEKTRLLKEKLRGANAVLACRYASLLPPGTGYAEAFEWNEYGAPLTDDMRRALLAE